MCKNKDCKERYCNRIKLIISASILYIFRYINANSF